MRLIAVLILYDYRYDYYHYYYYDLCGCQLGQVAPRKKRALRSDRGGGERANSWAGGPKKTVRFSDSFGIPLSHTHSQSDGGSSALLCDVDFFTTPIKLNP